MSAPAGVTLVPIAGGVAAAAGVRAGGHTAGLKPSGAADMAVVLLEEQGVAAAVLTANQVKAAPVTVTAEHLMTTGGRARAVLLNSGSANVCCGPDGDATARAAAEQVASGVGCATEEVLLCSTGVIGVALPREPYLAGIPPLLAAARADGGAQAAAAIMTTDLVPKQAAVRIESEGGRSAVVGGMAKGSGMIAPSMATMLCVVTTDAVLDPETAQDMLRRATEQSFNRISVDGVMSTNDTIILLATGTAAEPPDASAVEYALTTVLQDLAIQVVRDGEGAGRVLHITVTGAIDDAAALAVARQVAGDALVKTALAGADPNWGRVIAAVGAAPTRIDPTRITIAFAGHTVCRDGVAAAFDRDRAAADMSAADVALVIGLGQGEGSATFQTCDLTHGYITINAEYTT